MYSTTGYGVQVDRYWLARGFAKDICNCAATDANTQVKSDQEPTVVALQDEVREIREGKTIGTNSSVGESECNGGAKTQCVKPK